MYLGISKKDFSFSSYQKCFILRSFFPFIHTGDHCADGEPLCRLPECPDIGTVLSNRLRNPCLSLFFSFFLKGIIKCLRKRRRISNRPHFREKHQIRACPPGFLHITDSQIQICFHIIRHCLFLYQCNFHFFCSPLSRKDSVHNCRL